MVEEPTHPKQLVGILSSVLITDELFARPTRPAEHGLERFATSKLIEELVARPTTMLQRLCDLLVELCLAQTAGVSIYEKEDQRFRWVAVAGEWAPHLGGVMPFDASP